MSISKLFSGIVVFSLLSLGYCGIKSAGNAGADLSSVDIILTSAIPCGDNEDILACTVYFRNNVDRSVYLGNCHDNAVLVIEGKEYPALKTDSQNKPPRKLFHDTELYECFYFDLGRDTLSNIEDGLCLKVDGKCLDKDSERYFLLWFKPATDLKNKAVLRAKVE